MSRLIRLILLGLVLVVIVVACWFLLLSPLRAEIADTDESISAEQEKLSVAQTRLAQAEQTKAEGKQNQVRLLELAKMVPDSEEMPSLLIQINDLASKAGVQFMSISTGSGKESAEYGFSSVPLSLELKGTFFDLNDFIYRAEQMVAGPGRLLAVENVSFSIESTSPSNSTSNANLSTTTTTLQKVSPILRVSMQMSAYDTKMTEVVPAPAPAPETTTEN